MRPTTLAAAMLPEFDQEMGVTRRLLERLPAGKSDWKPHEKSMTLGQLAGHVAQLPNFIRIAAETSEFDLATGGLQPFIATSAEETVTAFDRNIASARAALEGISDEAMLEPWALLRHGRELFKMPRAAVLRGIAMNHIIHHRGQLSVYLRLTGAPVPSIYGPSADEPIV